VRKKKSFNDGNYQRILIQPKTSLLYKGDLAVGLDTHVGGSEKN
jgi:hypothetical protein